MDELSRQPKRNDHYAPLLGLLRDLQNHKSAQQFLSPVNSHELPDYYSRIKDPMDLATIESRLKDGDYIQPAPFVKDVRKVIENCRSYYVNGSVQRKNADTFEKFLNRTLKANPDWSVCVFPPPFHPPPHPAHKQSTDGDTLSISCAEINHRGHVMDCHGGGFYVFVTRLCTVFPNFLSYLFLVPSIICSWTFLAYTPCVFFQIST
jgi:hypothetical protein